MRVSHASGARDLSSSMQCSTAAATAAEPEQVRKMIVLSERISADAAFARQLRRKFV